MDTNEIYNLLLMQLSKLYKDKADEKGLSIRKLAGISQVANTTICDFFQSKYLPKIESLIKLAISLDIEVVEIIAILRAIDTSDTDTDTDTPRVNDIEALLSAQGFRINDITEIMSFIRYKEISKSLK